MTVNPSKNLVYVREAQSNVNYSAKGVFNTTSIIDGSTNTLIKTVNMSQFVSAITVDTNSSFVYLANFFDQSVSVEDYQFTQLQIVPPAEEIQSKIPRPCCSIVALPIIATNPSGIAVNPQTGIIYIGDSSGSQNPPGALHIYDTQNSTALSDIPVPFASTVSLVSSTDLVYVSENFYSDNTYVINASTNKILEVVPNLERSHGLAVDENRSIIYTSYNN
jgi:DNA-binding beta-propeller fold protein YncE